MNFAVFSLPRSRSYWLSRFLTHGDWTCGHDQARYIRGIDDVRSWLSQDHVGTVETAAAPWWRLAVKYRPDVKIVVIRRDPDAVVESLMYCGITFDRAILTRNMRQLDRKLDQIEDNHACLSFRFEDLNQEAVCAQIFEYCLGEKHDPLWWRALSPVNMQINLRALVRYEVAHRKQLARVREELNREVKALRWPQRRLGEMEGMTLQEEPFEKFWKDGEPLFREHCVRVGEPPDEYLRKNLPLMRRLAELGALQIITARSNGRMFGYITHFLSPSSESETRMIAQQQPFYASPDAWGLGLRLQHFALERLKERGGSWDVIMRAGVRGDGPRLGTLFRRMGAEEAGQVYKLEIN